jgi:hypothetical protein
MQLQIVKAENARVAAENLAAGDPPDQLRGSVEMPDTEVAIDENHGIARPLERSQQELGTFYRRAIAGAHRPTLEARWRPSSLDIEARHDLPASISSRGCSECWCDPVPPDGIDIVVKIPLTP